MGRVGKYSFHSEAGRADGTPGARERDPNRSKKQCGECGELSYLSVKRAGDFSNRVLCRECVQTLQEQKTAEQQKSVLSSINRKRER